MSVESIKWMEVSDRSLTLTWRIKWSTVLRVW